MINTVSKLEMLPISFQVCVIKKADLDIGQEHFHEKKLL